VVGYRDSDHKFGLASNGMARIGEQREGRQRREVEGVACAEIFPSSETPEKEEKEDSWYRRSVDKRNRRKS